MILLLLLMLVVLAVVGSLSTQGPMRRLAGGILLAVGLLVATGSGLCSLVIMFSGGAIQSGDARLLALIGGLPFLTGLGMVFGGLRLLRSDRPPSDDELRDRFD